MARTGEPLVCRLPLADRAQRTTDFRGLFADALVERQRLQGGVRWTLRAGPSTESESRRLAALEKRCCDGIRFEIHREGDVVVWQITGPAAANRTLDALFELPTMINSDEGAATLWNTLDAAACGSGTTR
jgi:hypothetical protein